MKWLLSALVVGMVAVWQMGCCCKPDGATGSAPGASGAAAVPAKPKEPPKPKEPDLTVTAKQLNADYQANEVAADDKYKGKLLRVSGTVKSIDKDFMDDIVIRLEAGDRHGFESIMATVRDSEKAKAKALSKKEAISVTCEGGGMTIGSPVLRNCKID